MSSLFAEQVLLPDGWARDVRIDIDHGNITAVVPATDAGAATRVTGPVIPGIPNLHSHAFQRAMAGLAETRGRRDDDNFWTWREAMYHLVAALTPEQMGAVAAQLYVELLRGGFTSIAEFHYLHNTPAGDAYADPEETSVQTIEAARLAGIGITHLPVLYSRGGFADEPLHGGQLRFRGSADAIATRIAALRERYAGDHGVRIGLALHSLRAVSTGEIATAVDAVRGLDAATPIHIHIAEQTGEVEECVRTTGKRPVEWLLENHHPDANWCLVHATHVEPTEVDTLAASGAIAGLCPTTEANLGDGIFPFARWSELAGRFGIGTDSHVGRSAPDELRWLEYGQRLTLRRRNVSATPRQPSVATRLWLDAVAGGAAAAARPVRGIAPGQRADMLVLNPEHQDLIGLEENQTMGAFVFSGGQSCIRDVMVAGNWVIESGRHYREREIATAYANAVRSLRSK